MALASPVHLPQLLHYALAVVQDADPNGTDPDSAEIASLLQAYRDVL